MNSALPDDSRMRALLERVERIAVVGIKAGEGDDAFRVPRYMQAQGYRILPVSPKLDRVLGEPVARSLGDLGETPQLVNLFRASAHIPAHTDEILALPSGISSSSRSAARGSTRSPLATSRSTSPTSRASTCRS